MNKRIACSVFLLSLASTALADQTVAGLDVLSYLSSTGLSFGLLAPVPMAQLTVTPQATYPNIAFMTVSYFSSVNGSCADKVGACTINNQGSPPPSLIQGTHYTSTDPSNYSLFENCAGWTPDRKSVV